MTELEKARQHVAELEQRLELTQRQLDLLIRHVFGKKSEQTPPPPVPGQMDLQLEAENAAIENAPPVKPGKPKGGSRKDRKIRGALLPDDLPVEETVIIPPAVQSAPERWREIDREVSERLERIPGGFLGPQFLADMVLDKYLRHLPLYRQAQGARWESGVILSAATMCQTIARVADLVEPVLCAVAEGIWRGGCVQMDLTPVRCLSRTQKGGSFLGHMRVAAQPGGDVVFTWNRSKQAAVAERIIPQWFQGVLQTDGGSELACFLKGGKARGRPPDIIRAGCWAHVRRKFFDGCLICKQLLTLINVLYRIEGVARDGGLSPAERALLRQRRARRVIAKLRRRMDAVIEKERPKSRAGAACLYALGQWKPLLVFLERGDVELGRVGNRRGDVRSKAAAVRQDRSRPCAESGQTFRFLFPLVEPDLRISRIRLSSPTYRPSHSSGLCGCRAA